MTAAGLPIDEVRCTRLLRKQLGKPWVPHAAGPGAWDCYTLLQYADRVLFGRGLPAYPPGVRATQSRQVAEAITTHPFYATLATVTNPAHGDYVELCDSHGRPVHVGLWLALGRTGGVLHCERGRGVAFDEPAFLKATRYAIRYRRATA